MTAEGYSRILTSNIQFEKYPKLSLTKTTTHFSLKLILKMLLTKRNKLEFSEISSE